MTFSIPNGHKALYDEVIGALIDSEYGINTVVYQPFTKSECPNCYLNTMSNVSANIYKSGGPISFTEGQLCPYCNGVGYIENQVSDVVKMMVYWDAGAWAKDNRLTIKFPDGTIITKGKVVDFGKINTCDFMELHNDLAGISPFRYRKSGEPTLFGIGKNSFFVCPWIRV